MAELLGAVGSVDSATTFLLPSRLQLVRDFIATCRSGAPHPSWPIGLHHMAAAKTLYGADDGSTDLVCAFLEMVADKTERMQTFYDEMEEIKGGASEVPSDEMKKKYRNPLASGGIYYQNYGAPVAAVRPCTLDADPHHKIETNSEPERELCGKIVSVLRTRSIMGFLFFVGLCTLLARASINSPYLFTVVL